MYFKHYKFRIMKIAILSFILFFQITFLCAQNVIIVNDSSQYGFERPRIVLLDNNVPFVIWGKPSASSKVFGSKLQGASFTSPIQISPDTMNPRVGSVDGPNVVSYKDSLYVVWGNQDPSNHHIFLNRSTDGGNSFGQPIQVDSLPSGENIEYPGVSISNDGTLGLYFIRSNSSWLNPRQSLIRSYDRGNNFTGDSVINTFSPGVPCECCQASMEMVDSNWVFYYRNNVSNVRNNYSLLSTNYGSTFNNVYEMDAIDWTINACPSSGPEGHISGNQSFTAWMSKATGRSRIWYNRLNISLGTTNTAQMIDSASTGLYNQNYPSVAGNGDTIAVVWEDNRYSTLNTFASVSIDGGQTFSSSILLSDTSISSSFRTPDVAYANGLFHFVWKKYNTVYYKSMTLPQVLSVADNKIINSNVRLYPNPTNGKLTIDSDVAINNINVLDLAGRIVQTYSPMSNTINVGDLVNGVYFIQLIGDENVITKKLVKN